MAGTSDETKIDPNDRDFIARSPLSVRAIHALSRTGHLSLSECQKLTFDNLFTIKNIGRKTANEIIDYIEKFKEHKEEKATQTDIDVQAVQADREYLTRILSLPLKEVRLSARATNVLNRARVRTLLDLVMKSPSKLLRIEYCGKRTLVELDELANILGLKLGMRFDRELLAEIRNYQSENGNLNYLDDIKKKYPDKYKAIIQARINNIPPERISFYLDIYRLYQEEGTLERVARIKNLTRERIRQILVKGTRLGLFRYSRREYHFLEKEQILISYSECPSLTRVAGSHHIPLHALKQLLTAYNITENDLAAIRLDSQKRKSIDSYKRIEAQLGRFPTTGDLQNNKEWSYLSNKITRLWGSFDKFREQMNIPKPIRSLPEATRRWQEKRKRLSLIIRMQYLDQIRDVLIQKGPLSTVELACECGIKPARIYGLLGLLIATGEVIRHGEGNNTRYAIRQERNKYENRL